MGREAAVSIHQVLVDQFIASFAEPPEELILDFDATDDRVHGPGLVGQAAATGLAGRADHSAGRLRLPPSPHVALV